MLKILNLKCAPKTPPTTITMAMALVMLSNVRYVVGDGFCTDVFVGDGVGDAKNTPPFPGSPLVPSCWFPPAVHSTLTAWVAVTSVNVYVDAGDTKLPSITRAFIPAPLLGVNVKVTESP